MSESRPRRKRRAHVPGGRPHTHLLKTSDEEEAYLHARAAEAKMTPIAYVMDRALAPEGGATVSQRDALITELYGLRKLMAANANNLNQIARAVNSGAPLDRSILHVLSAIESVSVRIDEAVRRVGDAR